MKRFFRSFFHAGRAGLRCALVEFNFYHGETMPTLVHVLNGLGVAVDVFAPERLRRNNPFVYADDLRYEMRAAERLSSGRLGRHFRSYDFVIINSLEPKHILAAAEGLSLPVLGVMHNAGLMITDRDYAKFFDSPKRKALVMAKHISDFVSEGARARWVAPVHLGRVNDEARGEEGRFIFCVQGNVEYERRDYPALLDAAERLRARGVGNFLVKIVGRNSAPIAPQGSELKADIAARGLQHLFEFSAGELPYKEFYGSAARADFLLPLVERRLAAHAPYFQDKLSTSMQVAIAFQTVPVVHADLAELYGVEGESFTYSDDLEQAMLDALGAGGGELRRRRDGLARRRAQLLDESARNLKTLLEEWGFVGNNAGRGN